MNMTLGRGLMWHCIHDNELSIKLDSWVATGGYLDGESTSDLYSVKWIRKQDLPSFFFLFLS